MKPIKSLGDLEKYCRVRAKENAARSQKTFRVSEERWHTAKADTYDRIADKIAELRLHNDTREHST